MSTTKKKSTAKKSAAKKTATKKTTSKAAARKTTAKKTTTRKTAVKKTAVKKTTTIKASHDQGELSKIGAKNLHVMAMDIDRQMKTLAEMDTRVIIAKDQLAEFRETVQAKIKDFQEKRHSNPSEGHGEILQTILDAKDEAAKYIRESKAINEAYDKLLKQLEKGREAAVRETRKAEVVFKEKFHEVEEKLLKKASEIKENIKNK